MKVAIIPPTSLLEEYGMMGDEYHLCLSARVLQDQVYAEFYRWRSKLGDWVILDNSAHEQLEGQRVEQLVDAATRIDPHEIVLPDRLFFGEDTADLACEALPVFRRLFPHAKLMGVPQGRTRDEWEACLQVLTQLGVDTVGISKDYEVWPEQLYGLIGLAASYGFTREQIHLLGWGRNLWELAALAGLARGVDSAKPIVYALEGVTLPHAITQENAPKYPRRRPGYDNEAGPFTPEFHDIAQANVNTFRAHARNTAKSNSNSSAALGARRVRSI